MTFDEYQKAAKVTANLKSGRMANWALGLAGETGEVSELVKKHLFHGAELNRPGILRECGDVLWYLAMLLEECGLSLEDCATTNIDKLTGRYPRGFVEGGGIR